MITEWIRFIIGGILLLLGLLIFVIEVIGIFRFKYVLNRMQVAAMGDTLGLSLSLLGLAIISGLNFTTLKLCIVCSHMLARMETTINEKLDDNLEELTLREVEAREASK